VISFSFLLFMSETFGCYDQFSGDEPSVLSSVSNVDQAPVAIASITSEVPVIVPTLEPVTEDGVFNASDELNNGGKCISSFDPKACGSKSVEAKKDMVAVTITDPVVKPTIVSGPLQKLPRSQPVYVEAMTWGRDSHGLFDYESRHVTTASFNVERSLCFFRMNGSSQTSSAVPARVFCIPANGQEVIKF
jgi:hypothetical protein